MNRFGAGALFLAVLGMTAAPARADHHARSSLLAAEHNLGEAIELFGPIDGFVPVLADDASYLHPGAEVASGTAAVRELLQSVYPQPQSVTLVLHPITGDVSHDRRMGFTFGWFEETAPGPSGAPVTSYGKYIAAWKKKGHRWRVHAFMRNNAAAPPTPPPADALILDGETGAAAPGPHVALKIEIMRADAAFAQLSVDQGYTIAFSAYTAEAAVLASPGDFFWNRAGVEAALAGWTPAETLAWHPLRAEAAGSGDLGWSIGYSRFSIAGGANTQHFYQKYLTIWIREADSAWKFLLDGGNTRPAP